MQGHVCAEILGWNPKIIRKLRLLVQSSYYEGGDPIPDPKDSTADDQVLQSLYQSIEVLEVDEEDAKKEAEGRNQRYTGLGFENGTVCREIMSKTPHTLNKSRGEDLIWWALRNLAWKWALKAHRQSAARESGVNSGGEETDAEELPESALGGRVDRSKGGLDKQRDGGTKGGLDKPRDGCKKGGLDKPREGGKRNHKDHEARRNGGGEKNAGKMRDGDGNRGTPVDDIVTGVREDWLPEIGRAKWQQTLVRIISRPSDLHSNTNNFTEKGEEDPWGSSGGGLLAGFRSAGRERRHG